MAASGAVSGDRGYCAAHRPRCFDAAQLKKTRPGTAQRHARGRRDRAMSLGLDPRPAEILRRQARRALRSSAAQPRTMSRQALVVGREVVATPSGPALVRSKPLNGPNERTARDWALATSTDPAPIATRAATPVLGPLARRSATYAARTTVARPHPTTKLAMTRRDRHSQPPPQSRSRLPHCVSASSSWPVVAAGRACAACRGWRAKSASVLSPNVSLVLRAGVQTYGHGVERGA